MATLDRIDRLILTELSKEARTTNKELASRVGLSQSACLERTRRLEERGILKGTHATIDPAALGVGVQALISVTLRRHTRNSVASFSRYALKLREVIALYHLAGSTDFLAHVVANDVDRLRDFTLDALTTRDEVARIETSIIFEGVRKAGWPDLTVP